MRWNGKVWRRWSGSRWALALYSRDRIRLTFPAPLDDDPALSRAARDELLALAVDDLVLTRGARVVHSGAAGTLVAVRRPVSHFMHGLLTLLSGGLWGVVWLMMCLARTDDRLRLEIDPWGHVWAARGKSV